jgi:hypothetical protein
MLGVADHRAHLADRHDGYHVIAICEGSRSLFFGVVESRKGAVALRRWANGSVSLPRSSNRTYGFAASGFPTDFVVGTRQQPTGAAFALPSSLFGRLLIVIGVCRLAPITSILAFFASASD